MEITGRLTKDATKATLKDGREVVNFSIAINDRYKSKGKEPVTIVTYVACSYWNNAGVTTYLKKGSVVELFGKVGVNVWNNDKGEAKGSLTMHVQQIKIFTATRKAEEEPITENVDSSIDPTENLPF